MAQADRQHTASKDLDDLLRYLTVELGYEKYDALWEMEQKYLDGQLQLEKQECVRDGEPYGDAVAIDANFGHIELDRRGRVRVVPLIPLWREVRYGIAEGCDARAIWPPHPPASHKAGPDPFKTGVADRSSDEQSSQESLKSKDWLAREVDRRKKLGDIPKQITGFSRQIHSQMEVAVRAGVVKRVLEPRTIETHLRETTILFPKKKRSLES
ncbi:MAG: hypothetical protein WAV38_32505 [Xanthobacteraceae bacterium]